MKTEINPTHYERALYLIACEHGSTRDEVLRWLSDESQWKKSLVFPEPPKAPEGSFVQTVRTTNFSLPPDAA